VSARVRTILAATGVATLCALVPVACGGGLRKTACLALARRIGDAPTQPGGPESALEASTAEPVVKVVGTSNDFDDSLQESGPPEYLFVALPPELDEDEKQALAERSVPLRRGTFRIERLKVEEEMPETAPAPEGDPSLQNPQWSLDLIDYESALTALAEQRRRQGRPGLDELPPGNDGSDPVVVGHPDTGYTFHRALGEFPFGPRRPGRKPARVRVADGYGFRDCTCSAFDLEVEGLVHGLRDARHGTATSSLIVGAGARTDKDTIEVRGIAPGAELMPLRVATGVIIGEARAFQMAMAVRHASLAGALNPEYSQERWSDECVRHAEGCRRAGTNGSLTARAAQVLSISMGGPQSMMGRALPILEKAMLMAERRGVIVIAAAGQGAESGVEKIFVKFVHGDSVVYPGAFESVIGVGATNIHGLPWKAMFRGAPVDVSAPGELVWNAKSERQADQSLKEVVAPGKGTSFSTAITAGVAALWLDYHGRDALAQRYRTPAAIPSAFKYALVHGGFNTPAELCALAESRHLPYAGAVCANKATPWDASRFGVGQLDARKLLTTPLPTPEELCDFVRNGMGPDHRWRRKPEEAATICPAS
jgi:subtilisin family serine protease